MAGHRRRAVRPPAPTSAWRAITAASLGRSFTTTYDFLLPFDPMGYAPFYSWATSGGQIATLPRKDGMATGMSNLIKYQGPSAR